MRLLYFGTGTFAEPTLARLLATPRHQVVGLVTNPDRPAGRGKHIEHQRTIKTLAQQHGLPIFQPESVNTAESVDRLRAFAAELFVVAAYGQILSPHVLGVPPRGSINVHASLLPKYRGAAPIAWAIRRGESETGVTIIRLSPRMDAGDMLAVARTPIGSHETAGELEVRLAEIGAELALNVIDQLQHGDLAGTPQDASQATRAPKLKKVDGDIDWTAPADSLQRFIYAMQPWPTAYSDLHRPDQPPLRLLIGAADAVATPATEMPAAPGQILVADGKHLVVACGRGTRLSLLEVQPLGKRRQPIADFQRGYRVDTRCRFSRAEKAHGPSS